jgi:hypothetical protein
MSPIFIQNSKILISGDKLRGCCCGGRWRISAVKIAAFQCVGGDKGEEIDLNEVELSEICPGFTRRSFGGDISGPIIVDDTTYYELKEFPRSVDINGWINNFPDGLGQEYPNPCSSDTFLLMDFLPKPLLPPDKYVKDEDGGIIKGYFQDGFDDLNMTVVYHFESRVDGNDGEIGETRFLQEDSLFFGCNGQENLPAYLRRAKKIRYTVNEIPDPDNEGATKYCLTNPVQLPFGVDQQGEPILEDIECFVTCCPVDEEPLQPKTYWEMHMKLQVLCSGTEWKDLENPSGLEAPTGAGLEPGTGDPGTSDSESEDPDTSSWLLAECFDCNSPCYIPCFEADENYTNPETTYVRANLDLPPFLDMDEEYICP